MSWFQPTYLFLLTGQDCLSVKLQITLLKSSKLVSCPSALQRCLFKEKTVRLSFSQTHHTTWLHEQLHHGNMSDKLNLHSVINAGLQTARLIHSHRVSAQLWLIIYDSVKFALLLLHLYISCGRDRKTLDINSAFRSIGFILCWHNPMHNKDLIKLLLLKNMSDLDSYWIKICHASDSLNFLFQSAYVYSDNHRTPCIFEQQQVKQLTLTSSQRLVVLTRSLSRKVWLKRCNISQRYGIKTAQMTKQNTVLYCNATVDCNVYQSMLHVSM